MSLANWTFSDGIADHIENKVARRNAKRRLERITRILKKATASGFTPEDYANGKELEKCYTAKNSELFSKLLLKLKRRECQQLFFEFFTFIKWEKADILTALRHLTHFSCKRKWKKGARDEDGTPKHVKGCMQKSVLFKWQLPWIQEEGSSKDKTDHDKVPESGPNELSSKICNQIPTDTSQPKDGNTEIPYEAHTGDGNPVSSDVERSVNGNADSELEDVSGTRDENKVASDVKGSVNAESELEDGIGAGLINEPSRDQNQAGHGYTATPVGGSRVGKGCISPTVLDFGDDKNANGSQDLESGKKTGNMSSPCPFSSQTANNGASSPNLSQTRSVHFAEELAENSAMSSSPTRSQFKATPPRISKLPTGIYPNTRPRRTINPPAKYSPSDYHNRPKLRDRTLCYCKKFLLGVSMVRCRNQLCLYGKWYHYDNVPPCVPYEGEKIWYCPECEKDILNFTSGEDPSIESQDSDKITSNVGSQQPDGIMHSNYSQPDLENISSNLDTETLSHLNGKSSKATTKGVHLDDDVDESGGASDPDHSPSKPSDNGISVNSDTRQPSHSKGVSSPQDLNADSSNNKENRFTPVNNSASIPEMKGAPSSDMGHKHAGEGKLNTETSPKVSGNQTTDMGAGKSVPNPSSNVTDKEKGKQSPTQKTAKGDTENKPTSTDRSSSKKDTQLPGGNKDDEIQLDSDDSDGSDPGEDGFSVKNMADVMSISEEELKYKLPIEFDLQVLPALWNPIWDFANKTTKKGYADVINCSFRNHGIPCAFKSRDVFKPVKESKSYMIKIRGYCNKAKPEVSSELCTATFDVHVKKVCAEKGATLHVKTGGTFVLVQRIRSGRPVTGDSRDKMKADLKHQNVLPHYLQGMAKTSNLQRIHGNYPTKSMGAERKMKSEGRASKSDMNSDKAAKELAQFYRDHPNFQSITKNSTSGYIQHHSDVPDAFVLYSPKQLRYANLCNEIYFDGTGSLIKKLQNTSEMLVHTAVGRIREMKPAGSVPLFDFLSISGATVDIDNCVNRFFTDMKKLHPKWKLKLIVTDFSLSYIHAIIRNTYNGSLEFYLQRRWDVLIAKVPADPTDTISFVCSGHMIFAVSRHLRKHTLNTRAIKVALHAFAAVIQMTTSAQMKSNLASVISLFGNPVLEDDVAADLAKRFTEIPEIDNDDDLRKKYELTIELVDIDLEKIFPDKDPKLEREKSVFYKHFTEQKKEIMTNLLNSNPNFATVAPTNPYYDEVIVKTFERWWTYLPLFSKVAFVGLECPNHTITTGYAEEMFKDYKGAIHNQKEYVCEFIREHADFVTQKVDAAMRAGFLENTNKRKAGDKQQKSAQDGNPPSKKQKTTDTTTSSGHPFNLIGNKGAAKSTASPGIGSQKSAKTDKNTGTGDKKGKPATGNQHFSPPTASTPTYATSSATWKARRNPPQKSKAPFYFKKPDTPINITVGTRLFRIGDTGYGTVQDILTLRSGALVNDTAAVAVAYMLLENRNAALGDKVLHRIVESYAMTETAGTFVCSNRVLPNIATGDIPTCVLYLISFASLHSWLTVMDFGTSTLTFYDSMGHPNHIISEITRTLYNSALLNALEIKYGIPAQTWKMEPGMCVKQQGCDCVIMALKNMEALLGRRVPNQTVNSKMGDVYRSDFTTTLLNTTDEGKKLLKDFNNDTKSLQAALSAKFPTLR